VRDAARRWLTANRSVTGYLIKDTSSRDTTAKDTTATGDKHREKRS
jgi:hypothetical protein